MKFNRMMTKFLTTLIMVSMVGTSVQIPTMAEIQNAAAIYAESKLEDTVKDENGSTESEESVAADDEDNKKEDVEGTQNEETESTSNFGAQNEENSQDEVDTSSSSGAYGNNNSSSSSYSNTDINTSQVLEPFSTENDSDQLSLDKSFSLFEYFGAKQTFSAIATNGDGNDIIWEAGEPEYLSISEPVVDGAKSTVDITWNGKEVEDITRTPFYAMLKSNPLERVTGTAYLSNGQAPAAGEEQLEPGSKTEFESEEVKQFVQEMYESGLTQENSVYDLSLLGDTESDTPDYSKMSDEEILEMFEENQADETEITVDEEDIELEENNSNIAESDKTDSDETENIEEKHQLMIYIIRKKLRQRSYKMM